MGPSAYRPVGLLAYRPTIIVSLAGIWLEQDLFARISLWIMGKSMQKPIRFRGGTYPGVNQAAREAKVAKKTIVAECTYLDYSSSRLRNVAAVKKALQSRVLFRGKTYQGVNECARHAKVARKTVKTEAVYL